MPLRDHLREYLSLGLSHQTVSTQDAHKIRWALGGHWAHECRRRVYPSPRHKAGKGGVQRVPYAEARKINDSFWSSIRALAVAEPSLGTQELWSRYSKLRSSFHKTYTDLVRAPVKGRGETGRPRLLCTNMDIYRDRKAAILLVGKKEANRIVAEKYKISPSLVERIYTATRKAQGDASMPARHSKSSA